MDIRSRSVSVFLVSLWLSGVACTSYNRIELTDVGAYEEIRVFQQDGLKGTLLHPSVELDSLRGYPRDYPNPVSLPIEQVNEVQAKVAAPGKTAAVIAASVIGIGLGVFIGGAIAFSSSF